MQKSKSYRKNVAAVILSPTYPNKCEFFIAHRTDIKNAWQFPQGGIDEGESPQDALKRELLEEIGCNDVEILGEYPEWITYDFPPTARGKCYPFDGQTQKYFLVPFSIDCRIVLLVLKTFTSIILIKVNGSFSLRTCFSAERFKT